MYNHAIHSKIYAIDQVMTDIREVEHEIQMVNDPSLIKELKEEREDLIDEFQEICRKCVILIEAYMEDCKDGEIPPSLDYYRVLKELKSARM